MIHPFDQFWRNDFVGGNRRATVINHTSFPAITNGPFGVVNSYIGGYVSWFDSVPTATSLGTWDFNSEVSLAAVNHGLGTVVFFGDILLLFDGVGADNVRCDATRSRISWGPRHATLTTTTATAPLTHLTTHFGVRLSVRPVPSSPPMATSATKSTIQITISGARLWRSQRPSKRQ